MNLRKSTERQLDQAANILKVVYENSKYLVLPEDKRALYEACLYAGMTKLTDAWMILTGKETKYAGNSQGVPSQGVVGPAPTGGVEVAANPVAGVPDPATPA